MHNDLTSQRAVPTGSTGGIGFAIAEELARADAGVPFTGCKQDSVEDNANSPTLELGRPAHFTRRAGLE